MKQDGIWHEISEVKGGPANPFNFTGFFLYLLKALENQRFSDVLRGYRKRPVVRKMQEIVTLIRDNIKNHVFMDEGKWLGKSQWKNYKQCWMILRGKNTLLFRSSCSQMFFKIDFLKNFAKFTGKHLCWSLFLINLQAWKAATLSKRDSNRDVFL